MSLDFLAISKQFQPLIASEAHRFQNPNAGYSQEDLEQEALLVVLKCCEKFDPTDNVAGLLKKEIRCRMVDINRSATTDGRNSTLTCVTSDLQVSGDEGGESDFWERYDTNSGFESPDDACVIADLIERIEARLTPEQITTFRFMREPDGAMVQAAIAAVWNPGVSGYLRQPSKLKNTVISMALGISINEFRNHQWFIQKATREVVGDSH